MRTFTTRLALIAALALLPGCVIVFVDDLPPEAAADVDEAIADLEEQGFQVVHVR